MLNVFNIPRLSDFIGYSIITTALFSCKHHIGVIRYEAAKHTAIQGVIKHALDKGLEITYLTWTKLLSFKVLLNLFLVN